MKQLEVQQITYEAFGKVHITYTDMVELVDILSCIEMITNTAKLRDMKHVTISKSEYDENNMNHIKEWYQKIGTKLSDKDVAELIEINNKITGSIFERHIPDDE